MATAWNKGISTKTTIISCLVCGTKRTVFNSVIKSGQGKYCSRKCLYESSKGHKTWNKDLKGWRTKEHSKKLRKAIIQRNKDNPLTSEQARTNGKKAQRQLKLITAHNRNEVIRRRTDYINWRTTVFKRDNHTCQHCCERGGKLNAHHIKSFAKYPQYRLDVDNGITLCLSCHNEMHF